MNSYKLRIANTFIVLALFVGVIIPVSASADLWYDGGYDGGSWGGGYDGGSYYDGGYDSGSWYDGGYDSGSWYDGGYDSGNWDDAGYDSGYYGYDSGYDGYDAGYGGYDAGYSGYDAGYGGYDAGYSYDYGNYDYGCGSFCGGSYSTPSHTIPGCSFCGGGGSSYSPPRYTPPVVTQPAHSSSSYYSNTNTNTNTNVNNITNTNIDNSIRDSFNNYNSNNTSLVVAQPQTPIVYTQPAPYCTINHALSGGSYNYNNNSAYLSWSSQNATSAFLSNVGSVNVSGSQTVYPGYTTTYTLTVYGHNGQSATCSTTVQANNYVPPTPTYYPPVVQQPYVSLTQIPYTGFDFGPIGNAIYWASLLSFAVAGAYLALYFRGGMFAFAGSMVANGSSPRAPRPAFSPVAPKAPLLIEKEIAAAIAVEKVQPVVAALRKSGTIDAMAIVTSKDGSMPKIVIERN